MDATVYQYTSLIATMLPYSFQTPNGDICLNVDLAGTGDSPNLS